MIFCSFLVSQYNQMKASKEVRGIEANSPAIKDERFAISEIMTTVRAVISVLINIYTIINFFHEFIRKAINFLGLLIQQDQHKSKK